MTDNGDTNQGTGDGNREMNGKSGRRQSLWEIGCGDKGWISGDPSFQWGQLGEVIMKGVQLLIRTGNTRKRKVSLGKKTKFWSVEFEVPIWPPERNLGQPLEIWACDCGERYVWRYRTIDITRGDWSHFISFSITTNGTTTHPPGPPALLQLTKSLRPWPLTLLLRLMTTASSSLPPLCYSITHLCIR